ncbi:MAG TPA: hypothetical protein VLL52_00865 [Anaerolineae bacterium]|nr:hypothetical protein [Anaerolineae bacterium]
MTTKTKRQQRPSPWNQLKATLIMGSCLATIAGTNLIHNREAAAAPPPSPTNATTITIPGNNSNAPLYLDLAPIPSVVEPVATSRSSR